MNSTSVVVCGLPEAGKLHVQHREGEPSTLHDVYALGGLLCALPMQPEAELAALLPALCLPDGVSLRTAPRPPPNRVESMQLRTCLSAPFASRIFTAPTRPAPAAK